MKLYYREYGTGDSPLLILHGLFGSSRNWHSIAQRLSGYRVYVPDARNHGASPWDGKMGYEAMDLTEKEDLSDSQVAALQKIARELEQKEGETS